MKPGGEVVTESEGDVAAEMEWEMQARDFFFHIGTLIVEGRIPQDSDKGRVEGPHCLSLLSVVPHLCDPSVEYKCQKASERKDKMSVLWQNGSPMVITVLIQTPDDNNWILLEKWTIEAVEGTDNVRGCSGSMLIQAIRSHIHFSQLSAWLSRSKGSIPSQITYRISHMEEDFTTGTCGFFKEPDFHTFPLANLHSNRVLRVSVQSLPRCDIFNFEDEILASKLHQLHSSNYNNKGNKDLLECVDESVRSPLKKKSCKKQLNSNHDLQTLNGNNLTNKQFLEFGKPSTSRTSNEELVERNCDRNLLNTAKISEHSLNGGFLKTRSLSEGTPGNSLHGQKNQQLEKRDQPYMIDSETKKQSIYECKKSVDCQSEPSSNIVIPNGVLQAIHGRHIGAGTLPIFNSRTGLPVSSSPAPLRRSATDLDIEDDRPVTNGVPEKSSSRDLTAILSKSAPASTTQSLLGNFEESVLNGRMEPLGTVEGFTAELGASGSFCPAHATLPVKAYFFSLSDDNAPSPYLGYISLNDPSISRKGYHVPTKGTVQLTLFNPNKTVVKMFVVLYDFSDMPPNAQTFLRQRTFSVWRRACHSDEGQNSLHYLIHLRFVSSKSGRLYLHTDIRVIFARQPPDLPSGVTFCTVTDGPTEPRYTL